MKAPARIMIFGRPGGGKSTFAHRLHQATGIPLYHLDKHFYKAAWKETEYNEFIAIQRKLVSGESWIIDGNNTKSLEMRYARANLVLYFNYPRSLCYWRIFKRLFMKNQMDDRAVGCKETISCSLLKYMWSFEQRVADPISQLKLKYPKVKFIEINSDEDLLELYDMLRK